MIVDIEDDIMDPVMQCTTLPSHSSFSQKKLVSFVTEIHTLSIDISLRDCLDDGVAASFQRSRIHKPHAHTQAFKTFSPITEHVEIMNHIEKQLAQSQQGWVDEQARAIPPSTESLTPISKEHNSRDKRKEGEYREVASIEEAYYRDKLKKYHDTRSSRFRFKLGDFVLLPQGNKEGYNVWQRPHIVTRVYEEELYKITDASDYLLV
ncbi:hypothetical protein Tco_0727233 [Tanacetum coccineum]|uniref:Uncharacterized protein n=1 Tax=Tanacetum coccineum TaxID=301880 RepID=A0ABQ4YKB7_9ASTR